MGDISGGVERLVEVGNRSLDELHAPGADGGGVAFVYLRLRYGQE